MVIVVAAAIAVNLYHTSYPEPPVQPVDTVKPELVEPATVPHTLVQLAFVGKVIAPVQSSLDGAGGGTSVTQILKPALDAEVGAVPEEE